MIKKFKLLKNHQGFMRYFKNTSWLFLEKILRMIVGLFVGIWVARYLGPEQFGLFSYAQSFVGLFSAIATLGLDGVVIKQLIKNDKFSGELIGTTFGLKLLGAIIVLSLLAITINLTANDYLTNLYIFIIASSVVFQSFNVIDLYFQSRVFSKFVVYAKVIVLIASSMIKIILILTKAPLIAFVYVVLFESIILAFGLMYFFIKENTLVKISEVRFRRNTAFALLRESWPLILSGVVVSIYMRIDQVMIKAMMGTHAVGLYAVAVRLSELWYFIPLAIVSSAFPALIHAKEESQNLYLTRLQKLYDLMVWLAVAIAIPVTFMSDFIIETLYGKAYEGEGEVLLVHIWGGVFVFLGLAYGKYLIVENLSRKSFYRTLFGVILNVLFNFYLIPIYGIIGAAFATLIAQVSANYLYDFFDKDLHEQVKMKTKALFPLHLIKGLK